MISTLLSLMYSNNIALEADDVSATAQNELGDMTEQPDAGNINQNNPSDMNNGMDQMGEDMGMDDFGMGNDDQSMGGGGYSSGFEDPNDTSNLSQDEKDDLNKKINLRENMIRLHAIITNNIKIISEMTTIPGMSIDIKTLNSISKTLQETKTYLFNEITEEFSKKSYVQLVKSYIIFNKIYDLCIDMLDKHRNNVKLQMKEEKSHLSKEVDTEIGKESSPNPQFN